jgi:hypothetical protein
MEKQAARKYPTSPAAKCKNNDELYLGLHFSDSDVSLLATFSNSLSKKPEPVVIVLFVREI